MTVQQSLSEMDRTDHSNTEVPAGANHHVLPIPVRPIPLQNRSDCRVSDGAKTQATLLFSGMFLGLVGLTFTVMGWIRYNVSGSFEWRQLLGPIVLSVGITFIFIGVCKFRTLSCRACEQRACDEEPPLDFPRSGQAFVYNGINQPIRFHRTTMVRYIPTAYASVTQEINSANGDPRNLPPQYYNIYPLSYPAFTGDSKSPPN